MSSTDVLIGRVNPSARLPFTVPADEADLPAFDADAQSFTYDRWHGWWRAARQGITRAYPFGFGLSYPACALSAAEASVTGDSSVVRATVRNTGQTDGADVVQVYVDLPDTDAPQRLVGFARLEIAAQSERRVEISIPLERLTPRDSDTRGWTPAAGAHLVHVSRHAGIRTPLASNSTSLPQELSLRRAANVNAGSVTFGAGSSRQPSCRLFKPTLTRTNLSDRSEIDNNEWA